MSLSLGPNQLITLTAVAYLQGAFSEDEMKTLHFEICKMQSSIHDVKDLRRVLNTLVVRGLIVRPGDGDWLLTEAGPARVAVNGRTCCQTSGPAVRTVGLSCASKWDPNLAITLSLDSPRHSPATAINPGRTRDVCWAPTMR